jgi:hypothetical protein
MNASALQSKVSVCANRALKAIAICTLAACSIIARAQTVGGHVGFVLPLVTDTSGNTTSLTDDFSIGFPMGITIKGQGRTAFDLEFIPSIEDHPRDVTLTIHPGFVWSIGHGMAPGIRAAFVASSNTYGFTPLFNKSWPIEGKGQLFKAWFVEADLPVRFNRPTVGPGTSAVGFAMHFGLGF